jgi:hypothetical protein
VRRRRDSAVLAAAIGSTAILLFIVSSQAEAAFRPPQRSHHHQQHRQTDNSRVFSVAGRQFTPEIIESIERRPNKFGFRHLRDLVEAEALVMHAGPVGETGKILELEGVVDNKMEHLVLEHRGSYLLLSQLGWEGEHRDLERISTSTGLAEEWYNELGSNNISSLRYRWKEVGDLDDAESTGSR